MNATSNRSGIWYLAGLAGAAVGGVAGYYLFGLALRHAFYMMLLPGACLGMGYRLSRAPSSTAAAAVCAIAAFCLGVFTEWRYRPFVKDDSLLFLIQNLNLVAWAFIVGGALLAYIIVSGGPRR